jgi:hypothetical protein
MGKHNVLSSRWPHHPRQSSGSGRAVGPDDRDLVEPDRGLSAEVSGEERAARENVHTDRAAQDDMRTAAEDPGGRRAVGSRRAAVDRTDPAASSA